VESLENQPQVFHPFHRPLKIPQNRRDFNISTAPTVLDCISENTGNLYGVPWKSGNRKARFPLSHRTGSLRRKVADSVSVSHDSGNPEQKSNPERKSVAARPPSFSYPAFPSRSSEADFMLIFQLENAT
jgi:hypothetical protein